MTLIQACSSPASRSPSSLVEPDNKCFFRQVSVSNLGLTEENFFDSSNRQIAAASASNPGNKRSLSCEERARQHCERFGNSAKGKETRTVQIHYQPDQFQMAFRIDKRTQSEVKIYRPHPNGGSLYCGLN